MSNKFRIQCSEIIFLVLCCCCFVLGMNDQTQNLTGAHPASSFSCSGRPAGYYADVETGCQLYHMCDGLGRQFSYSCPNTTLFQQRMLICDHWYMVNCSKAESDYAANLLIGQQDKPFVNDEENSLRTPRPDLLDRPYAPDYSGESFRSQYKQIPSSSNQIRDHTFKNIAKMTLESNQNVRKTHWKIPSPSTVILPPAYEPQIEDANRKPAMAPSAKSLISTPITRPKMQSSLAIKKPQSNGLSNAKHFSHKQDIDIAAQDDLRASHSMLYNASETYQFAANRKLQAFQNSTLNATVKVPSRIYEPPFINPIYNTNDSIALLRNIFPVFMSAPFAITSPNRSTNSNATFRAEDKPPTLAVITSKDVTTPTPAQGFKPPVARSPFNTEAKGKITNIVPSSARSASNAPPNDLLPPYVDFVLHDIATTQGPPIYYEWKVPSYGLAPPKLDPPFGVNGREYIDTVIDYSAINPKSSSPPTPNKSKSKTIEPNQFVHPATASTGDVPVDLITRSPTSRSIKEIGQPKTLNEFVPIKTIQQQLSPKLMKDISQIRKEHLVPDYAFPLENIGRTGYLAEDAYNSFQLKIPERRSDVELNQQWFGENLKCPTCHPSFV